MKRRKLVYLSPFNNRTNRYTDLQRADLEAIGCQVGSLKRGMLADWFAPRRDKVLVLNWYEDRLAGRSMPIFEAIRSIAVLVWMKIRVGRIIWIRHNFYPHKPVHFQKLQNLFTNIISGFSSSIVTHKPVDQWKTNVIPHPIYPIVGNECGRDIEFLIFGSIRKNKGLNEFLMKWDKSKAILMIGAAEDDNVRNDILEVISKYNLSVEWNNKFVDNDDLDNLLLRSKFVIIPNPDNTMIVSGAFYHAASAGANILIREGELFEYYKRKFSFVRSIEKREVDPLYVPPEVVREELEAHNGARVRENIWRRIIWG